MNTYRTYCDPRPSIKVACHVNISRCICRMYMYIFTRMHMERSWHCIHEIKMETWRYMHALRSRDKVCLLHFKDAKMPSREVANTTVSWFGSNPSCDWNDGKSRTVSKTSSGEFVSDGSRGCWSVAIGCRVVSEVHKGCFVQWYTYEPNSISLNLRAS